MPRVCSTCNHPDRDEIERQRAEGHSFRRLARNFPGVSPASFWRHFTNCVTSTSLVVVDQRTFATVVRVERHQEHMGYPRDESHQALERRMEHQLAFVPDLQYAVSYAWDALRRVVEEVGMPLGHTGTGYSGVLTQGLAELRQALDLYRPEDNERTRQSCESLRLMRRVVERARLAARLLQMSQGSENREHLEALAQILLDVRHSCEYPDALEDLAEELLARESLKIDQDRAMSLLLGHLVERIRLAVRLEQIVQVRKIQEVVDLVRQIGEAGTIQEQLKTLAVELERMRYYPV